MTSHVIQMICNSHSLCQSFGQSCYRVLDRYFLTVPAFHELLQLNSTSVHKLDLITRAKNNCVAYDFSDISEKSQKGRPRKKGNAIFVSTDLTPDPLLVVQAYAKRFNIECMFRELKQQVVGFGYHFWTQSIPKLNKYKKKSDSDPLTGRNEKEQKRILLTIQAMERFVLCAEIAMRLVQLIALNPIFTKQVESHRYLRTFHEGKVSEATVMDYLRNSIFRLLSLNAHSYISRLILNRQKLDMEEKEAA